MFYNKSNVSSSLHTKTLANFNYLLNSKKLIRLQEKRINPHKKNKKSNHLTLNEDLKQSSSKKVSELDRCLSEEASPKHIPIQIPLESSIKLSSTKESSGLIRRASKFGGLSPATVYGLEKSENKSNFLTKPNKKTKSLIPLESLHINLSNMNSPVKKMRKRNVNVDSIKEFQKDGNNEVNSNDSSPANIKNNNANNINENNQNFYNEKESEEENSVYIDSSWREIRKSVQRTMNSKNQDEKEKATHGEILKILKQINHSDIFMFDGVHDKNIRNVNYIQRNENISNNTGTKTINEIISPTKRMLKDPISYNLIESRANRFNIKNKRITLQGLITKSEWENEKNGSFPLILEKSFGKNSQTTVNKSIKKEFYSKWYLPVDYWKIEKPGKQKDLLDTPLKYGKP